MIYAYVKKDNNKMRIDSAKLSDWLKAGYTQITQAEYEGKTTAAPAPVVPTVTTGVTTAPKSAMGATTLYSPEGNYVNIAAGDEKTYNQYKNMGWTESKPETVKTGNIILYKGNDTMTVPAGDIKAQEYWIQQGWTTTKPATSQIWQGAVYQGTAAAQPEYTYVEKDGNVMQIDKNNLKFWRDAGYDEVSKERYEQVISGTATPTTLAPTAGDISSQVQTLGKALNIEQTLIDLVKEAVGVQPETTEVNNEKVLEVFNDLRSRVIDPYFQGQIKTAERDIRTEMAIQTEDYEELRKVQEEETAERIRQQQLSLEARGLTWTGEAARTLGAQSAIRGTTLTGTIPLANERIREGTRRTYLRNLAKLGAQAEQTLGSAGISGLGLGEYYPPIGGKMGEIDYSRYGALSSLYNTLAGQSENYLEKYKQGFSTFLP